MNMISKKKLRERLIDICNGAGYVWLDGDQYFEANDGTLVAVGNVIQGIERAFCLPDDTRLRRPWFLKEFDDLDTMVELVSNAIQYDQGSV